MKRINIKQISRSEIGITLIALVITIIVLLVLAGIAINALTNGEENAEQAKWAVFVTEYRNVEETERLYELNSKLNEYSKNGYKNIDKEKLVKDNILMSAKIASNDDTFLTMQTGKYCITDNQIDINNELEEYIYGLENDASPVLYQIDMGKLNLNTLDNVYAINVNTGKVYNTKGIVHKGLKYFTPDYGMKGKETSEENNSNDEDDSEDEYEPGELAIHYLPGYEGVNEQKQSIENIDSIVVSENMFNRDTYKFVGWKDITSYFVKDEITQREVEEAEIEDETIDLGDEEIIYQPGEEIAVEGVEIYLQAQWTQNIVKLNANGGKINGNDTYDYPALEGEIYGELPDAEREGYVFAGWYTDDGTFSNQIVQDDIYESSVTNLYANWVEWQDPNVITITYNANGGTCSKESKKIVKGKKIGGLPNGRHTKKQSYKFDCWTLSDKNTKINSKYIPTENITLYARFTIHMNFDYQGGTGRHRYKNVKIGGIRGYLYNYSKYSGYKIEGWYTGKKGNGDKFVYRTKITQTQDFTLYAYWLKKCTIKYNVNCDESGLSTPKNKYIYQTAKIGTLASPKRNDYTFEGWYEEPECINKVNNKYVVNNDIELYANWIRKNVNITFASNGGSGSMDTQVVEQNIETKINKNIFTKDKCNFGGWKDAAGNTYQDEENITISKNTKLTAQWLPWTHTIQYNLNGASGTVSSQTKTAGEDLTLRGVPTRTGYSFMGWNTRSDGAGTNYNASVKYTEDQDGGTVTLYAIWKASVLNIAQDMYAKGQTPEQYGFTIAEKKNCPTSKANFYSFSVNSSGLNLRVGHWSGKADYYAIFRIYASRLSIQPKSYVKTYFQLRSYTKSGGKSTAKGTMTIYYTDGTSSSQETGTHAGGSSNTWTSYTLTISIPYGKTVSYMDFKVSGHDADYSDSAGYVENIILE